MDENDTPEQLTPEELLAKLKDCIGKLEEAMRIPMHRAWLNSIQIMERARVLAEGGNEQARLAYEDMLKSYMQAIAENGEANTPPGVN